MQTSVYFAQFHKLTWRHNEKSGTKPVRVAIDTEKVRKQ